MKKLALLTIALLVAGSLTASATVLDGNVPASALIPIPTENYFGAGPISWDGEYTFTSTNAYDNLGSVFGYTGTYGFGANGSWDAAMGPYIGLNDSSDNAGVPESFTITFTNPVYEVGDYFNYAPGGSTPTTIAVYGLTGNLLDSYTLTFSTSGGTDASELLGFSETQPIGSLVASDNYIAMSATPEPGSFLLLGSGVLGLIGVARRKLGR